MKEKKKSIKVFYNNNFDKVCVVPCCLFLDCFLNCRLQPKRPLCASCFHVRLNSNANITNIAYILGNIGSYHKTELWLKKTKNMNFTFLTLNHIQSCLECFVQSRTETSWSLLVQWSHDVTVTRTNILSRILYIVGKCYGCCICRAATAQFAAVLSVGSSPAKTHSVNVLWI